MSEHDISDMLQYQVDSNEVSQIGEWEMVERVIDSFLGSSIAVDEEHYETTSEVSHTSVRWKHEHSDTHVKIHYTGCEGKHHNAWNGKVTINGGNITVGENEYSDDLSDVFEWAIEWMAANDSVDWLYE